MRYATLLLINDIPFLLFGLCRDCLGYFCELLWCKFEFFCTGEIGREYPLPRL